MDKEIQDAFVDGLNEVYSVMFTDGVNDGVNLYLLDPTTNSGFYKESKVKRYKKPVLLVGKAQSNMKVKGEEVVESEVKDLPKFTVTYKSLRDKGVACQTEKDWDILRRGFIEFHGAFYEIKTVKPMTFVEDVFLTILFECEYRGDITSILVIDDNEEEGGLNVTETSNDRRLE
jgi:hypothetical protein